MVRVSSSAALLGNTRGVVVFCLDHILCTFSYPDVVLAKAMEESLIAAVVNNPRVLCDMPRLLLQVGLECMETWGYVYRDIGSGQSYAGAIEAYAPLVSS